MAIIQTKTDVGQAVATSTGAGAMHRAHLRYLHIAPRKVRLLANTLKGLRVQEAEAQLMLASQRASRPLLKLLRSAVANALNNGKAVKETLVVSQIWVDQGPILKRSLPRAQGRATPLHKKLSHVTIVLAEAGSGSTERFSIEKKKKKAHDHEHAPKRKTRRGPELAEGDAKGQEKDRGGFFKRVFNRKSV